MPARRFIPATFLAAGIWSVVFCGLGYLFWQSFDQAAELARQGTLALLAVIVSVGCLILAYRSLRSER
jgi:undecaprenyl-diphosphatase